MVYAVFLTILVMECVMSKHSFDMAPYIVCFFSKFRYCKTRKGILAVKIVTTVKLAIRSSLRLLLPKTELH